MTLDSANGAIVVDGSLTGAPGSIDANTVSFAANSLLIVDAAKLDAQAAIISAGSGIATVADSAALHLANVKAGSETKILEGFDNGAYQHRCQWLDRKQSDFQRRHDRETGT